MRSKSPFQSFTSSYRATNAILARLLKWTNSLSMGWPGPTLVISSILAGISVWYSLSYLELETSQRDLISSQRRLASISDQLDEIDDLDNLVVVVENRDKKRSIAFIEKLASRLKHESGLYREIFYRIDPNSLKPWWLLYLDTDEISSIRLKLEEHKDFIEGLIDQPEINHFFSLINQKITSSMVDELFTGFLRDKESPKGSDPVDLSFLIEVLKGLRSGLNGADAMIPAWDTFFIKEKWDTSTEGYLWTDKKRYILLFMTPQEDAETFNKAASSLKRLRNTVAKVKEEFPDIRVGVTGPDALKADEMTVAFRDMKLATWISLTGVALIMVLFLRGFIRPMMELITLIIALCWTFGLATLTVGHLNLLSMIFAPMLLGLGIDYGIHWFVRLQEEEDKGIPFKDAVESATMRSGPAILIAGITAAASYFPMVLTGFKGLAELGLISGIGILMTLLASVVLLPAFVMLRPQRSSALNKRRVTNDQKGFSFIVFPKPLAPLCIGTILTVAALISFSGVEFDFNPLNLQAKDAEAVQWEMKLLEDSKRSAMYGAVIARSLDEARSKSQALESLPTVSKVHSVLKAFPEDQEAKLSVLRGLRPIISAQMALSPQFRKVDIEELEDILSRIRFKMIDSGEVDWGKKKPLGSQMIMVKDLIDDIKRSLIENSMLWVQNRLKIFSKAIFSDLSDKLDVFRANIYARPMEIDDLPRPFVKRNIGRDGVFLLRVWPNENIWERGPLERFVSDLRSLEPDAAGDPVTLFIFTTAFRKACIQAALYALVFIFLFVALYFRSILFASLALAPLLIGATWTVGLMWIFNVKFNVANSIFLPLIVGAGVEYGIIIISRVLEDEGQFTVFPLSTLKGIIFASLTTTLGFGCLMISRHQGVYSLGLLATIGSISVMIAAVTLLPALLRLKEIARNPKVIFK